MPSILLPIFGYSGYLGITLEIRYDIYYAVYDEKKLLIFQFSDR